MPRQKLLRALQDFVHRHSLIQPGEKILLAVSGGMDSVVLLDLLSELKKTLKFELSAGHCNHRLRGQESDDDEAFVKSLTAGYGLTCHLVRVDTKLIAASEKISIQEAARNARYGFFSDLRGTYGYQKIATAHNTDDNAETIIFNFLRGTGIKGLTGIPVWRKDEAIIRPLIYATRSQISQYASDLGLKYREDSSNSKIIYKRNYVRLKLIPMIRENINLNLSSALQRTGEHFLHLEAYIQEIIDSINAKLIISKNDDQVVINLPFLHEQPVFIQEQFFISTARSFAGIEVSSGNVATMMEISRGETGSYGYLSAEAGLYRDRDKLIFRKGASDLPYSFRVEVNNEYTLDQITISLAEVETASISTDPRIEFVDGDKLEDQLCIRSWREGDWFVPFGMKESKKLSDYFIDNKVPLPDKIRIPLLTASEEIVWVCGMRLDDRFKITSSTRKIIKLEYRTAD